MAGTFRNESHNNSLSYFIDGGSIFPAIMDVLGQAQRSIYVETFLFADDESGTAIGERLIEKARAGVDVRLLVSDKGIQVNNSFELFERMEAAGVKVCVTFPLARELTRIFGDLRWVKQKGAGGPGDYTVFQSQLDQRRAGNLRRKSQKRKEKLKRKLKPRARTRYRRNILKSFRYYDHRKIFVVDNALAIVGGMNIGNDYLYQGKPSAFGFFHDIGVRLEGEVVGDVTRIFAGMWNAYSGHELEIPVPQDEDAKKEIAITSMASFPRIGPNPIKQGYLDAIKAATRSVYIVNLFVSHQAIHQELIQAAKRKVEVHVISTFRSLSQITDLFTRIIYDGYYYLVFHKARLQDHGIKLHHFDDCLVHAKVGLIDDDWLTVGSSNLDHSSLQNASEINIAFRNTDLAAHLKQDLFQRDIERSVTLDEKLTFTRRVYLYFCYLVYWVADRYFT